MDAVTLTSMIGVLAGCVPLSASGHQLRKNDLVACMADRGTLACCELEALRVKDSFTTR